MGLFLALLPIVMMIGMVLLTLRWTGKHESQSVKVLVIIVMIYMLLTAVKIRSEGIDSLGFFDWFGILILLTALLSELWKRRRAKRADRGATPS